MTMNLISDRTRILSGNAGTLRLPIRMSASPSASGEKPAPKAHSFDELDQTSSVASAVRSEVLLSGRNCISIQHNDETYQLRVTRLGKLILTK